MSLSIFAALFAALSTMALVFGVVQSRRGRSVRNRMDAFVTTDFAHPESLAEIELAEPFSKRVVFPVARRIATLFTWMLPQNRLNTMRVRLATAGSPSNITPIEFLGIKGLMMFAITGTAILFGILTKYPVNFISLLMLGFLTFCGFYLPEFWLSRRIKERQQEILNSLPDALDLLIITLDAGLSFENGIQEIISKWDDELSREFARVLRDIGMGTSRRQALNGLSERTGVPDVSSFVASLNQADELGVSIARVLKVQAEELRIRRRQRAQEKANQAPIKMMFPLVFLIFPALFAVLLGPAVPQLLQTFDSL